MDKDKIFAIVLKGALKVLGLLVILIVLVVAIGAFMR